MEPLGQLRPSGMHLLQPGKFFLAVSQATAGEAYTPWRAGKLLSRVSPCERMLKQSRNYGVGRCQTFGSIGSLCTAPGEAFWRATLRNCGRRPISWTKGTMEAFRRLQD